MKLTNHLHALRYHLGRCGKSMRRGWVALKRKIAGSKPIEILRALPRRAGRGLAALQEKLAFPVPWRWALFAAACLLSGLLFAVLTVLIDKQGLPAAALAQAGFWYTALFFALLTALFGFLTHSLFAGCLVPGLCGVVLSFVNYFKELITAAPLTIGEFHLIGQAGQIVSMTEGSIRFDLPSVLAILLFLAWMALAAFFTKPLRIRWKGSLTGAAVSGAAFLALFWLLADPLVFSPMGLQTSVRLSQANTNQTCGPILGLWRSAYQQAALSQSADYTPEKAEELAEQLSELVTDPSEAPSQDVPSQPSSEPDEALPQPNIILILSESFSDPTRLNNVAWAEDPAADYHALQAEGVSGTFYTRSVGGGTCNVELEVLTGLNTGLLAGEDLYSWAPEVFSRLPSVVSVLRDEGYRTAMVHTYNDTIYNRTESFAHLGFDQLYFSADLAAFYPPAAQAEDYWAYMDTRIKGRYYSDELLSDALIALYEKQSEQTDQPLFLYGISMENHTPYAGEKFLPEQITVSPQSELEGEAAEILLSLSQGLSDASAALGQLADYFRNCDEPTIIVFFGDHRAGLGLTEGGHVYAELGMAPADRDDWTLDHAALLYSTDYLIWSNDPAYLPADPGSTVDSSCNYLGVTLLELAQAEKPFYWQLLTQLYETRLCDTIEYHLGQDGTLTDRLPESGADAVRLKLLADIIQDTVYGEGYLIDKIS